jgi:hypothetical protein
MVSTRKDPGRPSVSRRTVLGGLAAPLIPGPAAPLAGPVDPVLTLWAAWRRVSAAEAALAAEWATRESRLTREIGFPRVAVPAPDGGAPVWVTTHDDIDAWVPALDDPSIGAELHDELDRRLASWRRGTARVGMDEIDRQIGATASRGAVLAETLIRSPASSLPGVIAKLELILQTGQTASDDDDVPWRWLRRAIADLRRLAAEPGAAQSV